MVPNNDKKRTYSVTYVPKVGGLHKVSIHSTRPQRSGCPLPAGLQSGRCHQGAGWPWGPWSPLTSCFTKALGGHEDRGHP